MEVPIEILWGASWRCDLFQDQGLFCCLNQANTEYNKPNLRISIVKETHVLI